MSERAQFHAALSRLYAAGALVELRTLVSLAEELLEAVGAELSAQAEPPAARVNHRLILEWANEAACKMLNMTLEEAAGTPLSQLALACNLETYERCILRALHTRLPVSCYIRDRHGRGLLCEYYPIYGTLSVIIRLHPAEAVRTFDFAFAPHFRVVE